MKYQSIYIISSLIFLFLLNACNSLDKLARQDQEYDDLYYSTKDRPVYVASTSRTPVKNNTHPTQSPAPSDQSLDIPFDNENINSEYVAPNNPTYSTNSYFDPNYQQNLNTDTYYPNSNLAFQNDPYFYDPFYRANTWCPPTFNRGLNFRVGFGNTWGRGFGSPFYDPFYQPWPYGYGFNNGLYSGFWNTPYYWNSPFFYNQPVAVYYPSSGAIYNGVNNTQEVVQRTRYYGPRTNTGANKIISNASRRRSPRGTAVRTTPTTTQPGLTETISPNSSTTRTTRSQRYPSRTRSSYDRTRTQPSLTTTPNTTNRVNTPNTPTTPKVTTPTRTRTRTRVVSPSRSTPTRTSPTRKSPSINRTRTSSPTRRVTPTRRTSPSRTSPSRSSGGSRTRSSTPVKRSPRR